jgi:Family of unknown function (DUF6229)
LDDRLAKDWEDAVPAELREDVDDVVGAWLREADQDNPAGPLYTGGEFVEADIVATTVIDTRRPTACTGANTFPCC